MILTFLSAEASTLHSQTEKKATTAIIVLLFRFVNSVPPILQWPVVDNVSREVQEPDSPRS